MSTETQGNTNRDTSKNDVVRQAGAEHLPPSQSIRSQLESGISPIHNFDGDKRNQWRLSTIAVGADAKEGSKMDGEIIDLRYYYCHVVRMVSQKTGDEMDAYRTVLFSKDGTAWRFVSTTVIDALDNIRAMFGNGPYDETLKFTINKADSRKGNKIYNLVPVEE